MEIEHHKWPSRKDWNSWMAKPWGISILSWRSRVVFNPVITSDDPINYIVVYSRNFHQVICKTLCLKKLANKRKISRNSNVSNEKLKHSKKKNSRNSDGLLTIVISRIFWLKKIRGKLVGFQLMVYLKSINWNLTIPIPINGILKIH